MKTLSHRIALYIAFFVSAFVVSEAQATNVTFRYQPVIGGVNSVSAAGSFNGWDAAANPLADADEDGIWEVVLDLPPGRIAYKFVVNGDQWFADDFAAESEDDGFGGSNSVVKVGDEAFIVGVGSSFAAAPAAGEQRDGLRRVTFRFHPPGTPTQISLAGTFNDWTPGKTKLADVDGDGEWTVDMLLSPGEYQYKFVVGADGWTQDVEGQDGQTDDGHGGQNSIINVDDRYPNIEVRRGDGEVFPEGIMHAQASNEVNNLGGGRVEFTARAHIGDIEQVTLVYGAAGALNETLNLRLIATDKVYEYYRVTVTRDGAFSYALQYIDGGSSKYMTATGLTATAADPFTFDPALIAAFITPEWVKDAVIYQIFPDRFHNGDPSNDQDFKEWYYAGKTSLPPGGKLDVEYQEYYHLVKDWKNYSVLSNSSHTPDGRDWMAFYGGDIEGVRKKLDYLQELGVTAVYFNPIFEGKSTHKYDGADYKKVDPHFGTNELIEQFIDEAHDRGIRVILDIVYNHSGNSHWAFKDAVEKGPASPYYQWFEFKKHPLPAEWPNMQRPWKPADYYYCWWGFGDLPDLNFDLSRNNDAEKTVRNIEDAQVNIGLVKHLLEATTYWLQEADADGVRLDVPNEVPYWFWKLYCAHVRKVKPDAYIVGELWGNAADHVKPGMYDAVMNYAFFRDPVQRFLGMGQGTASEFDATLTAGRLNYPTQAVECQMNLLDSHDTVRFLTQVGGNVNRLKLAAMFGMTYVGAPHIYYGDEIAMEGGRDPDCRRPMIWDYEKEPHRVELLDYYKALTKARHAHRALRTGDFTTVHAEGKVFGYVRSGEGERFLVALNAGRQPVQMPFDPAAWGGDVEAVDMLSGETLNVNAPTEIPLPAEGGRLFHLRSTATGSKP